MKFGCLLAVKDIVAARQYYEDLFGIKVIEDYGRYQGFDCGLGLQQDFDWLTGVDKCTMAQKENNCELFFEQEDFDGFVQKLKARANVDLLHDVKTPDWGQRSIRFYDPDGHMIEVGESMKSVVQRFLDEGKSMEEIAKVMEATQQDVQNMLQ